MIPISKPSLGTEELKEVERVFRSGWLGIGKVVEEFEEQLRRYLGAKYVIAVNSGTSALHIALDSVGIKQDDEVIIPSLTFVAVAQAIVANDARPIFCEVEKETLNIDIEDAERLITSKTKAVVIAHYCGIPSDIDRWKDLCRRKDIYLIEDAAHAFGSKYKSKSIGSFGNITCFSFDPIKNITCGDGGCIAINDRALADIIRKKRMLGISKYAWKERETNLVLNWKYNIIYKGFRYHLNNIAAAIGICQLKKIDKIIKKRRVICRLYNEHFSKFPEIKILLKDIDEIAPFMYVIRVRKNLRDNLIRHLYKKGIQSGVHYKPIHLFSLFRPYCRRRLPVTESVWKEIVTLPLYYDMKLKEARYVIDNVLEFLKNKKYLYAKD